MAEEITEERETIESPISLFVKEKTSADSVITISWCIRKEVFEKLKASKIENPHLLLVVVEWDEDYRRRSEKLHKLVPLSQALEYIQFQGPGLHRIIATIVWHSEGNIEELREFFLSQYGRFRYENNLLTFYKDDLKESFLYATMGRTKETSSIEVDVAEEFFAKEPPEWLKWWVNLCFAYGAIDQCDFRRRCLITFPWKSILVLLWITVRGIIGTASGIFLLFLCGIKGVNFKPIYKPFSSYIEHMWRDTDGSIFLNRKYPFLAAFTPVLVLPMWAALVVISYWLIGADSLTTSLILGLPLAICFLFLAITSIWAISLIGIHLFAHFVTKKAAKPSWQIEIEKAGKKEAEKELRLNREYLDLSFIMCNNKPPVLSLKDLPKEKRTFHLRFLDLKAKVCRPFARY